MWSGKECLTRKALVSWDHISGLVPAGDLNLICLKDWNKATIGQLMWNMFAKKYKLWINWIHMYYLKKEEVAMYIPKVHYSWIIKVTLKYRDVIMDSVLGYFSDSGSYKTKGVYQMFRGPKPKVTWRNHFFTVTLRGQERHLLSGWHVRIGCA